MFVADDFAVNQIGYSPSPALAKLRRQRLRQIVSEAEELGLIRPCKGWSGYFQAGNRGTVKGKLLLRWSRGPLLRTKQEEPGMRYTDRIENDALYAQVQDNRDEDNKPITPHVFHRLITTFGREQMQKHVTIILAQKEHHPGSFQKSELAAYINRMQHDHPEPDWYQDLKRAERLSLLDGVQPTQTSKEMYETFFR